MKRFYWENFLKFTCFLRLKNSYWASIDCFIIFSFRDSFRANDVFYSFFNFWLADYIFVQMFLNLFRLWRYFSIHGKNDCFPRFFGCVSFDKGLFHFSFLIFLWNIQELCKHMIIGCKAHQFDAMISSPSFLCKNWKLSATMWRSNYEPCTTFENYLAFGLSSNSNKWCSIWHLFNFYPFKCYPVWLSV